MILTEFYDMSGPFMDLAYNNFAVNLSVAQFSIKFCLKLLDQTKLHSKRANNSDNFTLNTQRKLRLFKLQKPIRSFQENEKIS